MLNLFQINTIPNIYGSILDLILSKSPSHIISQNSDSIVPMDNYHPPLNICYTQLHTPPSLSYTELSYDWSNGNYNAILSHLGSIDWSELFKISNDISFLIDEFYAQLYFVINTFIPKKTYFKSKFPRWFSKNLINLIKLKKTYHLIYKMSNSHNDYLKFSSTRSQCKALSKLDYSRYLITTQNSLKSQPKKFWSFIKNLRSSHGLPNSMSLDHVTAENGQEIVDLFSHYFSSVYNNINIPIINMDTTKIIESNDSINKLHIELIEVFNELNILDYKNSIGPDGLSPLFLFNCRFILSPPIMYLFNTSLKNGIFPTAWKSTYINPIHKKGNKSLVSNYRPISIISILPKIFSKIVNRKLTPIFKNILVPHQHGFRSNKSSVTNLITIKHDILESFSKGQQTDVIYTDFEKAFDSVNHKLLTHKLLKTGFANPLLSWINSFLCLRTQIIKYKSFISIPIKVTSGVPQGDHLSPLLFNLFINDVVSSITHSKILLFADDAKIYKSISSLDDISLLQKDLTDFNEWCFSNGLSLNINKCQILTFSNKRNTINFNYSISDTSLERVHVIKDLGISFDSKLLFNLHILAIKNKALSVFGMIKRNCSQFNNPFTFKCLYTSLIRSILEYAPIIWENNSNGHSDQLEKIQNKVLRFICIKSNIPRTPHSGYEQILNILHLESLKSRRINTYSTFLTKLINNEIDDAFLLNQINFKTNSHNLRNKDLFYLPHFPQKYMLNDPLNILMSCGNKQTFNLLFK